MKTNRIQTRFRTERRFEVDSVPVAPFRATQESELERLKSRLLRRQLDNAPTTELYAPLRRAANDAAALAWATSFPLLFFPALLEEKVREARHRIEKQNRIRARTRVLFAEAA